MKPNSGLIAQHSVLVVALCAVFLAFCASAEAQQPTKIPRLGFLSATSPDANSARIAAFRQGLHDAGYMEGKNILIEWRWAEGHFDRLPSLAAELIRLNVDVIVSSGPSPTRFSKQATTMIPIVMQVRHLMLTPISSSMVFGN